MIFFGGITSMAKITFFYGLRENDEAFKHI